MRMMPPSRVLVGRDTELMVLAEAFAAVCDGSAATILIEGEAGIGKTRLITEFAASQPARVLTGGCLELGAGWTPFAPFTAVLRELGAAEVLELVPRNDAGELGRLLPAFDPPIGPSDPALARARLFEQILAVLQGVAEENPVIVMIEDLQWADRSSSDLLSFLVHNQRAMPGLLLLATCRTEQLDRSAQARHLLATMDRLDWVQRLELGRLTRNAVTAQLETLLGRSPEDELVARVFRRSQGNPLFVETLAVRTGYDLPESLKDVLKAPFEKLPGRSQGVLRSMAVGRGKVGHELLSAITGLDDFDLSDAVRPAVLSSLLVVDGDDYVFRHPLLGEVLANELLPAERAELHVRYGEVLTEDPSLSQRCLATELAYHWYAVRRRYPARALAACWNAGAVATSKLAYAERMQFLYQVLELWAQVPDAEGLIRADLDSVRREAIEAALLAGEPDRAMTLITLGLADTEASPGAAGQLFRFRGELLQTLGEPGDLEDLRRAAEIIPAGHPAQASILNTLADRLLAVPCDRDGLAVGAEALRAAQAAGDLRQELAARTSLAYAAGRAGELETQLPLFAVICADAERLGDDRTLLHALRCEADLLQGAGRHEEAVAVGRRGLTRATDAGLSRAAGPTHAGNVAEALISLGRWDEAIELVDHVLELEPTPSLRAYLLVLHGTVRLARDDLSAAEDAVGDASEILTRGTPYAQDLLLLVQLQLDLLERQGRRQAAADLLARTLSSRSVLDSPRYLWPVLVSGVPVSTPAVKAELRLLARRLPVIGPLQRAHQMTFSAELGEGSGSTWPSVADAWARLRQPYPQAQALLRAVRSDPTSPLATRWLQSASEHADRLAAPNLRAQLDRLSGGLPVSSASRGGPFGLTARELEVLRLLAKGHTNRQIASELFIAVKTASAHVSNIFSKLEVTGRVQAVNVAYRFELLSQD